MFRGTRRIPNPLRTASVLAITLVVSAGAVMVVGRAPAHELPIIVVGSSKSYETTLTPASPWHSTSFISAAVNRALVTDVPGGVAIPVLIEEVPTLGNGLVAIERSENGLGQTVVHARLRSDLKWSDGQPLTSADVKFTYELLWQFPYAPRSVLEAIERIDAPSVRDVVIRLRPGAELTVDPLLRQPIYPRHVLAGLGADAIQTSSFALLPVGAGPYVVREWRYVGAPRTGQGIVSAAASELYPAIQSITLEPNPFFAGLRPSVSLRLSVIPDEQSLAHALRAGAVDLVAEDSLTPGSTVTADLERDGFHVERSAGSRLDLLEFNLRSPTFADVRVRRAIGLAIDRRALALELLADDGAPMTSWLPRANPAHADTLSLTSDLALATRLLDEVGPRHPPSTSPEAPAAPRLRLGLAVAQGSPIRERAAIRIQEMLRAVAIEVEPRAVPLGALVGGNGVLVRGAYDLALIPWRVVSDLDALDLWHSRMVPTAENAWRGNNLSGWAHPDNDRALERAAALASPSDRVAVLNVQQRIFASELPALPLFEYKNVAVRNERLRGFILPVGDVPSSWRAEQWMATGGLHVIQVPPAGGVPAAELAVGERPLKPWYVRR